jgi:hypothetical protein
MWSYYTLANFSRVRPFVHVDPAPEVEEQDRPLLPDESLGDGCAVPTQAVSELTADSAPRLVKRLGVCDLVFYGVGSTVGAGIYSLVGPGLREAGGLFPQPKMQ